MIRKIIILVLSVSAIGILVMALSGLRIESRKVFHSARYRVVARVYDGRLRIDLREYLQPLKCRLCTAEFPDHAPSCGYAGKARTDPMEMWLPDSLRERKPPRKSSFGIRWEKSHSVTGEPMYGVATADNWRVEIPNLHLFVLLAAYPTIWLIRVPLRRRHRRKRGLCVECGYNLTGLTAPRCPECSAEFTSKKAQPERRDEQRTA